MLSPSCLARSTMQQIFRALPVVTFAAIILALSLRAQEAPQQQGGSNKAQLVPPTNHEASQQSRVGEPQPFASKDGKIKGWKIVIPGNRPLATPAVVEGKILLGGGFGSHEFYA